jgi:hypothetical protein
VSAASRLVPRVSAPDMATTAVPGAMWLMLTSRIMGEMYHGMMRLD